MSVRGGIRLRRKLNGLAPSARKAIGAALAASVLELDGLAKERISGGGRSGRTYTRRSVSHTASAAGEYPKTDRGQLVASLFNRVSFDGLKAWFGTRLNYGRYLEYGTSRMAARPWLRPTFVDLEGKIKGRINKAVKAALERG